MGRRKKVVEDNTKIILEQSIVKDEYNPDTDEDLKMIPSRLFDNNYSEFKSKYKLPKSEMVVETIYVNEDKYIITRNNDNYILYNVDKDKLNKLNKSSNPMSLKDNNIKPLIEKLNKKKKKKES